YGSFSRVVRLFGAACALLLPAVFLALVLFSPGAMPMTLLTSVIESRATVPVGLFGESVLMLLMFNLINEAGQRIPGVMGSSLGLVSALILGSAAVDAALVSPLLIIVIALGGLGSYALPGYPMSFMFRILQLFLLLVAGLAGLPGLLGAFVLLTCMAAGTTSLGRPYLAPVSPTRPHNPDIALRAPIFRQRLRAYLADPAEMQRSRGRMRRFGKEKKS
ncbi:MAG: spore germination protein, partial [Eubacteriales bacterium]|nr:spore germination protein [Eubacteriales bacterium]